ncbi:alpha-D-ribose 1-methylphosphonate 5-triphosphate diphosphatase [Roseiterribacter gracilis]|uniref:Phosphonate metabolism protein PhnM n=1 Tax=Roseiterribacter gracilis TaxID=2812848 RepID=A0A8S8X5P7_9PROT|nr:phosphonate metabolism protein PhnM [Rhodospirillales bacterium TMPK1]
MTTETIFTNAKLVLEDRVLHGTLVVRDGKIAAIDETRSNAPGAIDFDGDYLLPGLVELHTDHLERHLIPRPGVRWPARSGVMAHDAQIAAAGITTVFDALAVGDIDKSSMRADVLDEMIEGVAAARDAGALRADHWIHLRCEVSDPRMPGAVEKHLDHPLFRFASLMDHTPGQRQFLSIEAASRYYRGKYGMSEDAYHEFVERRLEEHKTHSAPNRARMVLSCRQRQIPLASHDDATEAHIAEAVSDGVVVAEFPTTVEAARAAHEAGLKVLGGAPNVVRGGSHSGNVAIRELAQRGWLDVLSSDYVPVSLLQAAFALTKGDGAITLPAAMRLVTAEPARAASMHDRGRLETGLQADLVRVRDAGDAPIVRTVWRAGARVI